MNLRHNFLVQAISSVVPAVFVVAVIAVCGSANGQAPNRGSQSRANGPIPSRTTINGSSANNYGQNHASRPPQGWELNAEQQKWIDQVLNYWEAKSEKVRTFSCTFDRWEYNPAFVRDPKTPWTQARGEIKYAKPDKALYRVTDMQYYQTPKEGGRPSYVRRDDAPGEYWVCDGNATYEFVYRDKQVIHRDLPVHMRGEAIAEGPLPFLFGAKAAKLKQRYWFRPMDPPKDPKTGKYITGEYWLAAKPKTLQDSQNLELVEIILDQKEFLPKALQIYMPGGKERKVFQFAGHSVNPRQPFWQAFIKPDVPRGWKLVRQNMNTGRPAAANAQHRSQIPVSQRR